MSNEIEASISNHEDVVIDVIAWEKSMKKKLEEYTKEPTEEEEQIPTIYRVPERIRLGVNDPYEPQVMSIGPYHWGKPTLEAMEKNKWWCLHQVLSRNKKQHQLQDYIVAIKKLEVRARSCYSEKKEINLIKSKDFVEMMLLDGCFIVQLLRKEYKRLPLNLAWLVRLDMLLLENQIPFFILECISDLSITNDRHEIPIMELAKKFCSIMLFQSTRKEAEISHIDSVHHLLHMFHMFHTFTPQLNHYNTRLQNELVHLKSKLMDLLSSVLVRFRDHFLVRFQKRRTLSTTEGTVFFDMIPSAIELHDAGVKFRKKREWHSLLEVTFKDGVIEIPPLLISDISAFEFRNLIAFEQLYPLAGTQFCEYATFMDDIISTSNDVALLHKEDIIQYMVGSSEDVANLFNKMNRGVVVDGGRFTLIYGNVNRYCKEKKHQWRASLVRNYFNNPWSVISLVAAAVLLILTFIQTYFSGYSVWHSKS